MVLHMHTIYVYIEWFNVFLSRNIFHELAHDLTFVNDIIILQFKIFCSVITTLSNNSTK